MQKDLHLTSPSLAQYHIKKLVEMGLVQDTQEGYVVKKVVLKSFFRIRNTILPFQVFYAVFFGSSLVALLLLLIVRRPEVVTSFDFVAIVVNVVALLASIYETRRTISNMP
jgi:hypothetical protein